MFLKFKSQVIYLSKSVNPYNENNMRDLSNWKSQLKNAIRTVDEAAQLLGIDISPELQEVTAEYPVFITPYYLNLIDRKYPENDPIWKICMPDVQELVDTTSSYDPLSEEDQMPVPQLIHRYPDRVVMLTTNRCPVLCRHCFRKRKWKDGEKASDISDRQINAISTYISAHSEVKEILISGGDPLMLNDRRIKNILDKLSSIEHLDVIRIATRVPVTLPMRIDKKLISILKEYPKLWFVTHFNHENELTEESISACRLISQTGIPILNQAVLLKGVNDNADTLEKLFRKLVRNRIKPHYLFHVDPVRGVKHFATGIQAGLDILKEFKNNLSSIAVPHFAIDLPEGGGKVALQPDYTDNGKYIALNGEKIEYY